MRTMTEDEVIDEVAETLRESGMVFIMKIANQVLTHKVEFSVNNGSVIFVQDDSGD